MISNTSAYVAFNIENLRLDNPASIPVPLVPLPMMGTPIRITFCPETSSVKTLEKAGRRVPLTSTSWERPGKSDSSRLGVKG